MENKSIFSIPSDLPVYLRLKELPEKNLNLISKSSEIIKLPVPILEKISAPELKNPKNLESFLFIKNYGGNVTLTWNSCAEDFYYDIEINKINYKTNDTQFKLVSDLKLQTYTLKKPKAGIYQWRVKCFNKYLESPWSSFKEFNVTYGK